MAKARKTGNAETASRETAPERETADVKTAASAPAPEKLPNPCVWCGPSVKGVARQYTTYQGGGIPDALRDFIKEHPEARRLIVSTAQFPNTRRRLDTPGTEQAKLFRRVKEEMDGGRAV